MDDSHCQVRHLLYHVLPVARTGTWQRNLDQLKGRLGIFNGRRLVAVSTAGIKDQHPLDPPEAVAEYLKGYDCDIVTVANDSRLREVASWGHLWGSLSDCALPGHCALYAHAKAVTRPFDTGNATHVWANLMYHVLLDYPALVCQHLGQYPVTGAFKKVGHAFGGSRSAWHYSGSWFWARLPDFFAKNWRDIDLHWWGTESFPGLHWKAEEAGCLFHEGRVPTLDLYSFPYIRGKVMKELKTWKQDHRAELNFSGAWPAANEEVAPNGSADAHWPTAALVG